jgi:hypothetical protein
VKCAYLLLAGVDMLVTGELCQLFAGVNILVTDEVYQLSASVYLSVMCDMYLPIVSIVDLASEDKSLSHLSFYFVEL